jgi:hypothetical protein
MYATRIQRLYTLLSWLILTKRHGQTETLEKKIYVPSLMTDLPPVIRTTLLFELIWTTVLKRCAYFSVQ